MAHDKMLEKIGVKEIHRAAILQAAQALQRKEAEEAVAATLATEKSRSLTGNTTSSSSGPSTPGSSTGLAGAITGAAAAATTDSKRGLERDLERSLSRAGGSEKWLIKPSAIEFVCRAGNVKERERIGAGTSGKVYRAIYMGKDDVAVKILKPWTSESQVEEFKKEFEIMVALRDPYIVKFYGACLEPKLCLVMEFCSRDSSVLFFFFFFSH